MAVGVSLHKWAEAISLGTCFKINNVDKRTSIIMIIIFSFTSPLGIIVGIFFDSNLIVTAVFYSITTGYLT